MQKKISLVEHELKSEVIQKFGELGSLIDKEQTKINVVNSGVYNSGKSSLYNAIIGKNFFMVGDIPTTIDTGRYEADEFVLTDTPGFDADNGHDEVALAAYQDADMIIYVSNILNGGLNSYEIKYLKILRSIIGDSFSNFFVFVLSNAHQVNDVEQGKITEQVKQDFAKSLGIEDIRVLAVDSKTYMNGLESCAELVEFSGVPEVKSIVSNLIKVAREEFKTNLTRRITKKAFEAQEHLEKIVMDMEEQYREKDEELGGVKDLGKLIKEIGQLKGEFIKSKLVSSNIHVLNSHVQIDYSKYFSNHDAFSSESAVESAARSLFSERYYSQALPKARVAAQQVSRYYEDLLKYSMKKSNYYFQVNVAVGEFIRSMVNKCLEVDVVIDGVGYDFTVEPEISTETINRFAPQNLAGEAVSDLNSASQYCYFDAEINETEVYAGSSWRGETKYKTKYSYSILKCITELKKDIEKDLDYATGQAVRCLTKDIEAFHDKVKAELEKRIGALLKVLDKKESEQEIIIVIKKAELKKIKEKIDFINDVIAYLGMVGDRG